jgi:hypothetical protein
MASLDSAYKMYLDDPKLSELYNHVNNDDNMVFMSNQQDNETITYIADNLILGNLKIKYHIKNILKLKETTEKIASIINSKKNNIIFAEIIDPSKNEWITLNTPASYIKLENKKTNQEFRLAITSEKIFVLNNKYQMINQ